MIVVTRVVHELWRSRRRCQTALLLCAAVAGPVLGDANSPAQHADQHRIELIDRLSRTAVCIFDTSRAGGGSGVVITEDGLGLTNYHVVAGMLPGRRGYGGLSDGKLYELEVLGVDVTGDVAMFRLTGRDQFDFAELGDSDTLRVGDPAIALGNPFTLADDYTPTATLGTVSGLHRYQAGRGRRLVYSDCIQIDTSINPGNSGGPLFDANGRLIAINGRIQAESRGRVNVGLGFAIPINQIKRFLPGLRAGRSCAHGTLDATVYDAPDGSVVFDRMYEDGPAFKAGIRVGDRLVSLDGVPIDSANRLKGLLGAYPAGWRLPVGYERQGQRHEVIVELAALPVDSPHGFAEAPDALPAEPPAAGFERPEPAALSSAHPLEPLAKRVMKRVVRLYGAAIGREPGYGCGVLVSAEGRVVTVMSLLLESPTIEAIDADGRRWPAAVVARDETRQLALLQLAPEQADAGAGQQASSAFNYFEPGDSSTLRRGSKALAAANPFRVAEGNEAVSIAVGTFSGRTHLIANRGTQPFPYTGEVLVIDAITSNPGSPGGALVDLEGRWVGLLGKRVRSRLTNTNLNYALPVEEVTAFLAEVEAGEPAAPEAHRGEPYHGIKLFELGYPPGAGKMVYIESVRPDSPADRAGLLPDDLIMSVNGRPVSRVKQFRQAMSQLGPGDQATLVVKRGDRLEQATLELEPQPGQEEAASRVVSPPTAVTQEQAGASSIGERDVEQPQQTPDGPVDGVGRVAESLEPCIVTIETVGGTQPLFDEFGLPIDPTREGVPPKAVRRAHFAIADGPTTGLVYSSDGLILTSSFNFVGDPLAIAVVLSDGRRFVAELLARDRVHKLALLKIDAKGLPVPSWARRSQIRTGRTAIALGRGFGTSRSTVSVGIVSATARMAGHAIQTDAKLSPANYGGPLIDLDGRVIGVCVPMGLQPGELVGVEWYDSGIGFAIPYDVVESAAARLAAGESIERGWLGISMVPDPLPGVVILSLATNSPAERVGLQPDDRIMAIDGHVVWSENDLLRRMNCRGAGETVELTVARHSVPMAVQLTLAVSREIDFSRAAETDPESDEP